MVAGATASTRQKLSVLTSSSSDMSSDNTATAGQKTTDHQNGATKEAGNLLHFLNSNILHEIVTASFCSSKYIYEKKLLSL